MNVKTPTASVQRLSVENVEMKTPLKRFLASFSEQTPTAVECVLSPRADKNMGVPCCSQGNANIRQLALDNWCWLKYNEFIAEWEQTKLLLNHTVTWPDNSFRCSRMMTQVIGLILWGQQKADFMRRSPWTKQRERQILNSQGEVKIKNFMEQQLRKIKWTIQGMVGLSRQF